jgi:hypothetical protein
VFDDRPLSLNSEASVGLAANDADLEPAAVVPKLNPARAAEALEVTARLPLANAKCHTNVTSGHGVSGPDHVVWGRRPAQKKQEQPNAQAELLTVAG